MLKDSERAYIIEVLTSFHNVWCPFCLIDLHPALAQELSQRTETEVRINKKIAYSELQHSIELNKPLQKRSIMKAAEK